MVDRIVISADPDQSPNVIHYASDRAREWQMGGPADIVLALPPGIHAMLIKTDAGGSFVSATRLCHDGHPTLTTEERQTLLGMIEAVRPVAVTG